MILHSINIGYKGFGRNTKKFSVKFQGKTHEGEKITVGLETARQHVLENRSKHGNILIQRKTRRTRVYWTVC